jgi:hypothetical protein
MSAAIHPDVYAGFAASIRKKLGTMPPDREHQHVLHYAQLTALHEACHAVAYALNGAELQSVDLLPSARGIGYTLPNLKACTDSQLAIGCFAGCIGELLSGDAATFVEATDHDVGQAMFSCMKLCSGGDPTTSVDAVELQRIVTDQWNATVALLMRPTTFSAIHSVAAALLARGRLDGSEVHAIIDQTKRPAAQLAKPFRQAKEDVADVTSLIPDLARRWLSPCGTKLREGAFSVVEDA